MQGGNLMYKNNIRYFFKYLLWLDFFKAFGLAFKYFSKKGNNKLSIREGRISSRFRGEHALRRYANGEESYSM